MRIPLTSSIAVNIVGMKSERIIHQNIQSRGTAAFSMGIGAALNSSFEGDADELTWSLEARSCMASEVGQQREVEGGS
jgi:hypothetical protein